MIKLIYRKLLLGLGSLTLAAIVYGQESLCPIHTRIAPDGALYHFHEPESIDSSGNNRVRLMVFTDKTNYFLALLADPDSTFKAGVKLKGDLHVKFQSNENERVKPYDLQLLQERDTAIMLVYLITKRQLKIFTTNSAEELKFELKNGKTLNYQCRVRQDILQRQLRCLLNSENDR